MQEKRILLFGTFDGLHDGHRAFLAQARGLGGKVIAVVARDESVMRLKNHAPRWNLEVRMRVLEESALAHHVVPGDETEGRWEVILKHRPNIIALGYDQRAMHEHLARAASSFPFNIEIVVLDPHEPERLHSSLLNKG